MVGDEVKIMDEARQQVSLFKNALGYTLALQAIANTVDTNQSFISLGLSVAIVINIGVVLRNHLTNLSNEVNFYAEKNRDASERNAPQSGKERIFFGIIRSGKFILDIVINVLTQFLSTIIGRYIIDFSPDLNIVSTVIPIIILTFTLLWSLMLSLNADERHGV